MFHVLIDTSVWLDLAQDAKLTPLLLVVETLVVDETLTLIVPRVVVDEFHKNRDRVAKTSARSLAGHFQQVREAVRKGATDTAQKDRLLRDLDDLNHRIPLIGGAADSVLGRVERLLGAATVIETADAVKQRAAERALSRKAPCHHENKNSIADAIVLETYFDSVSQGVAGQRFAFVTHNKLDFSVPNGNQKLPHPDFAERFSKIKSMYFINLGELLTRIDPSLTRQLLLEQTWEDQPRALSEILDASEVLFKQVWYNRHKNLAWKIKDGEHRIVSREEWEQNKDTHNTTIDSVWRSAVAAAIRTERELGRKNVGPWDDFQWGMINGKLSALRWVLGDEWDMLDT